MLAAIDGAQANPKQGNATHVIAATCVKDASRVDFMIVNPRAAAATNIALIEFHRQLILRTNRLAGPGKGRCDLRVNEDTA
jgi:hypothetical protein